MPVTRQGLRRFDRLPAAEAVVLAFTDEGNHPRAHRSAVNNLRESMPLLHRAILRLVEEKSKHPSAKPELVAELPIGLCGNRKDHLPHVHESATLGTYMCHADQTRRLPNYLDSQKEQK